MRWFSSLLFVLISAAVASAQSPQLSVKPVYPAAGEADTRFRIDYSITPLKGVTAAWIEIWDRPKRLWRTRIRAEAQGSFLMPDYEEPEDADSLTIAINDPQVVYYCIDECNGSGPMHGGRVSETVIGVSDSKYWDTPDLFGVPAQRIIAGAQLPSITLFGHAFSAQTRVILLEQHTAGGQLQRTIHGTLPSEFVDLCTLHVTIPSNEVLTPAELALYVTNDEHDLEGESEHHYLGDRSIPLFVARPDSPIIDKLGPVMIDKPAGTAWMTIFGRNFTPQLRVTLAAIPDFGTDTQFVSSNELRVNLQEHLDSDGTFPDSIGLLRLVDGDDSTRVSAPIEFRPEPRSKTKPDPLPALICSVDPYPLERLPPDSSPFLKLTVRGHNFRRDDTVIVKGRYSDEDIKLKTTFISAEKLVARFPRDLWRVHKISFRLVVLANGTYYAAEVPDTE
jgi:hypothetical protein